MRTPRSTAAAAAGFALGVMSVFGAPAFAALDPATLEDIQAPEVVQVAHEIAAVLDDAGATADEQAIAAELHEYLSESLFSDQVLLDALGVVLAGDWSDSQLAALRRIYAEYAPEDVQPPAGGGTDRQVDEAALSSVAAPGPTDGPARLQSTVEPPLVQPPPPADDPPLLQPPPPADDTGSDYTFTP